jgi:hypothetical protein
VSESAPPVRNLNELEKRLSSLSHSDAAISEIKQFAERMRDSRERLNVFNASGAIVRAPILSEETKACGFNEPDDDFTFLQGDVISTESAYFLGERVTNSPKYVVLSSSCDLIPDRRKYAALLRIKEIREGEADVSAKLNLLLKFMRTESMYLPALPSDGPDVLCNAVKFDGLCQIRTADLVLSNRIASLTLVGWRIFASFSRMVIARANPREPQMRSAIEQNLFNVPTEYQP